MKIKTNGLPKFVTSLSVKEIKLLEQRLLSLHNKLVTTSKIVQEKKFEKFKIENPVIEIVSRISTSSARIKEMLKTYRDDDKLTFETYLDVIEDVVSDLEQKTENNKIYFDNVNILKHYRKVVNCVLKDTEIMNIMNYCIKILWDNTGPPSTKNHDDESEDDNDDDNEAG